MSVNALISNISRGSLHDGPGIRTVIYFKGCGLRCRWCHNPETFSAQPQILFNHTKCIGCGKCAEICPEHHLIQTGKICFVREGCASCGQCADACPTGALNLAGRTMTAEQVMETVVKDKHYYDMSDGGVTFSGGECLLYPEFTAAVANTCRQQGIHTVVETALFVPWENVEWVRQHIDLFYVDIKLVNEERHRLYTGQDNRRILENLRRLLKTGANVVIRIPLIPHVNDTPEDMEVFGAMIRSLEGDIQCVALLKYNHLAESKYLFLDMAYTAFAPDTQSDEAAEVLRRTLATALAGKCEVIL